MVKEIANAIKAGVKGNSAVSIIKEAGKQAKALGKFKAKGLAKTALTAKTARTVARAAAISKVAEARESAAKYNYNATLNALSKYNSLINMNPTSAEGTGEASNTEGSNSTAIGVMGNN